MVRGLCLAARSSRKSADDLGNAAHHPTTALVLQHESSVHTDV